MSEDDRSKPNASGAALASLAKTGACASLIQAVAANSALLGPVPSIWRSDEVRSFDLTTADGLNSAQIQIGERFPPGVLACTTSPMLAIPAAVIGGLIGFFSGKGTGTPKQLQKSGVVPQNTQLKFAQSIITYGKKQGVKKLKITVDKDLGASLGASYAGASLKGQVDSGGKFHLEVEYK